MRRQRLQHGAQLRGQFRILEPVRLVEVFEQRSFLVGDSLFITTYTAPFAGGWVDFAHHLAGDIITADVTDVPREIAKRGAWVEVLGSRTTVDDLTDRAGTIGYELLTRLGRRVHRVYIGTT